MDLITILIALNFVLIAAVGVLLWRYLCYLRLVRSDTIFFLPMMSVYALCAVGLCLPAEAMRLPYWCALAGLWLVIVVAFMGCFLENTYRDAAKLSMLGFFCLNFFLVPMVPAPYTRLALWVNFIAFIGLVIWAVLYDIISSISSNPTGSTNRPAPTPWQRTKTFLFTKIAPLLFLALIIRAFVLS